jgi:hypothetical protein
VAEPWTHKEVHYSRIRQYPHMGGKAATVRLIILFLHSFLEEIAQRGYVDEARKFLPVAQVPWFGILRPCVHNLASYIHRVSTYPVLLQPQQVEGLRRSGTNFLVLYRGLAAQQLADGSTHFKIRPKLHFLHHVQLLQGRLNPKVTSCWNDETFIGNVTNVAGMTSRLSMSLRTLQRYMQRLAKELRLP